MAMENNPQQALIAAKVSTEVAEHAIGLMTGRLRHALQVHPYVLEQAQRVNAELARLQVLLDTAIAAELWSESQP